MRKLLIFGVLFLLFVLLITQQCDNDDDPGVAVTSSPTASTATTSPTSSNSGLTSSSFGFIHIKGTDCQNPFYFETEGTSTGNGYYLDVDLDSIENVINSNLVCGGYGANGEEAVISFTPTAALLELTITSDTYVGFWAISDCYYLEDAIYFDCGFTPTTYGSFTIYVEPDSEMFFYIEEIVQSPGTSSLWETLEVEVSYPSAGTLGESCLNAEQVTGTTHTIMQASTLRYGVPSCASNFGNINWVEYETTAGNNVLSVTGSDPNVVMFGIPGTCNAGEWGCSDDGELVLLSSLDGTSYYIGVASPTAGASITPPVTLTFSEYFYCGEDINTACPITAGTNSIEWLAVNFDYPQIGASCNISGNRYVDVIMSYTPTATKITEFTFPQHNPSTLAFQALLFEGSGASATILDCGDFSHNNYLEGTCLAGKTYYVMVGGEVDYATPQSYGIPYPITVEVVENDGPRPGESCDNPEIVPIGATSYLVATSSRYANNPLTQSNNCLESPSSDEHNIHWLSYTLSGTHNSLSFAVSGTFIDYALYSSIAIFTGSCSQSGLYYCTGNDYTYPIIVDPGSTVLIGVMAEDNPPYHDSTSFTVNFTSSYTPVYSINVDGNGIGGHTFNSIVSTSCSGTSVYLGIWGTTTLPFPVNFHGITYTTGSEIPFGMPGIGFGNNVCGWIPHECFNPLQGQCTTIMVNGLTSTMSSSLPDYGVWMCIDSTAGTMTMESVYDYVSGSSVIPFRTQLVLHDYTMSSSSDFEIIYGSIPTSVQTDWGQGYFTTVPDVGYANVACQGAYSYQFYGPLMHTVANTRWLYTYN